VAFSYSIYQPLESYIHRLSPATKLVVCFTIMLAVLASGSLYAPSSLIVLGILLAVTISLLAAARMPWGVIKPFVVAAIFLGVFFSLSWVVFTHSGTRVFVTWGPTDQGLLAALNSGIRVFIMVMASALLLFILSETELIQGLRRLHVPYILSFTLMLSIRLLPSVVEDLDYIRQAQMTRGTELQKGRVLKRTIRGFQGLIPLVAIAFRRVDTLSRALESRAFEPRSRGRSVYHEDSLKRVDRLALFGCAALVVAYCGLWIVGIT
jgi:energy-coupling factor transport system permease protein